MTISLYSFYDYIPYTTFISLILLLYPWKASQHRWQCVPLVRERSWVRFPQRPYTFYASYNLYVYLYLISYILYLTSYILYLTSQFLSLYLYIHLVPFLFLFLVPFLSIYSYMCKCLDIYNLLCSIILTLSLSYIDFLFYLYIIPIVLPCSILIFLQSYTFI